MNDKGTTENQRTDLQLTGPRAPCPCPLATPLQRAKQSWQHHGSDFVGALAAVFNACESMHSASAGLDTPRTHLIADKMDYSKVTWRSAPHSSGVRFKHRMPRCVVLKAALILWNFLPQFSRCSLAARCARVILLMWFGRIFPPWHVVRCFGTEGRSRASWCLGPSIGTAHRLDR